MGRLTPLEMPMSARDMDPGGQVTYPKSHSQRVIKAGVQTSSRQSCTYSANSSGKQNTPCGPLRAAPDSKVGSAAIMGFLPIKELKDFRKTCAHGHTHPFKQLFLQRVCPSETASSYSYPQLHWEGVRVIARCGWHTSDESQPSAPTLRKAGPQGPALPSPSSSPSELKASMRGQVWK